MRGRKRSSAAVVALAAASLTLGGCLGNADPRTSNQGGGNILTASGKVAGETMTKLTADEVQILADNFTLRVVAGPAAGQDQLQIFGILLHQPVSLDDAYWVFETVKSGYLHHERPVLVYMEFI